MTQIAEKYTFDKNELQQKNITICLPENLEEAREYIKKLYNTMKNTTKRAGNGNTMKERTELGFLIQRGCLKKLYCQNRRNQIYYSFIWEKNEHNCQSFK